MINKKAGKRFQILAAARGLFSTKGYETTTIDDIVNTVGVGKGTFYAYFRNKTDLLLQFLEEVFQDLCIVVTKAYRPKNSPQANLLAAFRVHLQYFREHRDLINILEAVKIPLFDDINRLFLKCFDQEIHRWQADITKEIADGRFRKIDPSALLASMMVVNHMLLLREIRHGVPARNQDLKELEDLLLYGLLNPSQPPSPAGKPKKLPRKTKS